MKSWVVRVVFALCVLTNSLFAAFTYESAQTSASHAPQGTDNFVMMRFQVGTDGAPLSIKNIRVRNASNVNFGPNDGDINAIRLFHDLNGNNQIDEDDTLVGGTEVNFNTSPTFLTLSFSNPEEVSSSNFRSYLILYDIGPTALLDETTNVILEEINYQENNPLDLESELVLPTTNTVTISGIDFIDIQDISPDVVLPGQKKVAMFYMSIKVKGESISESSDPNLKLTIFNEDNNLVVQSGEKGVDAAYLYKTNNFDSGSTTPFFNEAGENDPVGTKLSFSDPNESEPNSFFTFLNPFDGGFNSLSKNVTHNFFLVYDISDDIDVTDNTQISAQMYKFEARGDLSRSPYTINWPGNKTRDPKSSVNVAGLTLTSAERYVPANSVFGDNTTSTIMRFRLRSNHTDVEIDRVNILNPGTVKFITTATRQFGGIEKVELFEDSEADNEYSETDRLIGTVTMGEQNPITNLFNQTDSVLVPIVDPSNGGKGLLIQAFDDGNAGSVVYPQNNERVIFVVYHFGTNIQGAEDASGNVTLKAIAQLGEITGTANIVVNNTVTQNAIDLSRYGNNFPASANPQAEIDLQQTNITLRGVTDIAPASALEGQVKVPVLAFELNSETAIPSSAITIYNHQSTFSELNQGISRVSLYLDQDQDKVLDSTDTFLSSTRRFEYPSEAKLAAVPIVQGENHYLVLYDVGQEGLASSTNIRAQVSKVEGDLGAFILLGGQVPAPFEAGKLQIQSAILARPAISLGATPAPEKTSFNITISVSNQSGSNVVLEDVQPKFYLDALSGKDISFEFSSFDKGQNSFPLSLLNGETKLFNFEVLHRDAASSGATFLDSYVKYQAGDGSAVLQRYEGKSEWKPGASALSSFVISARTRYAWEFPSYIESVSIKRGITEIPFLNNNSVLASDEMFITFRDPEYIDTNSIHLELNGQSLIRSTLEVNSVLSFSYDEQNGRVKVPFLGEENGTLTLSVSDGENSLDSAMLSYQIHNDVKIHRPLFYPNPYSMGSELLLGFNLTQSAEVKVYFYNQLGILAGTMESSGFLSVGYNTITISGFEEFIAPGIYVCKLVATDSDGNKAMAMTKLAVR